MIQWAQKKLVRTLHIRHNNAARAQAFQNQEAATPTQLYSVRQNNFSENEGLKEWLMTTYFRIKVDKLD